MNYLVIETRQALVRAVEGDSCSNNDSLSSKFKGCCGLAQCIAGYALQDIGATVRPIATQSLKEYWHGHAALCLESKNSEATSWFLIDPTFCQFCEEHSDEKIPSPAYRLLQSEAGAKIVKDLLSRGYTELNPQKSALYLSAFCEGKSPFSQNNEAFNFFKNPPHHPYHFRRDENSDAFSRENLDQRNLLIRYIPFK